MPKRLYDEDDNWTAEAAIVSQDFHKALAQVFDKYKDIYSIKDMEQIAVSAAGMVGTGMILRKQRKYISKPVSCCCMGMHDDSTCSGGGGESVAWDTLP